MNKEGQPGLQLDVDNANAGPAIGNFTPKNPTISNKLEGHPAVKIQQDQRESQAVSNFSNMVDGQSKPADGQ